MEIVILVENSSDNSSIKGKHGLSLLIKLSEQTFLYDFGPKNTLLKNAKALFVNLEAIDFAVLSHNHIDHGGAINQFCEINNKALIHVSTDLSEPLYSKFFSTLKIPVGTSLKPKHRNRVVSHEKSTEIAHNVFLTKLSPYTSASTLNKALFIKKNSAFMLDTFEHESALVVIENGELVVFCSCSHHGVSHILNDVELQFPSYKIKAYVGGFHMYNPISKKNENEKIINEEIIALKNRDIKYYTGHCTGELAFDLFKNEFGEKIKKINTGMKIML